MGHSAGDSVAVVADDDDDAVVAAAADDDDAVDAAAVYEVMNPVAASASHNILCGRKSRDTTILLHALIPAKSRPGEWYASPWLIKLLKEQLDDIRTLTKKNCKF